MAMRPAGDEDRPENPTDDQWLQRMRANRAEHEELCDEADVARCIGMAVLNVKLGFDMLSFHWEEEGGVSINVMNSKTNQRRSISGRDERDALAAVLGKPEPRKRCRGPCGLVKPLRQFSMYARSPDGRNSSCLVCERARVKAHSEAKKEKKDQHDAEVKPS